jgi:hypothetical protein
MKRLAWIVALLCSLMAAPVFALTGNVNMFLGEKQLDNSDWNPPFDEQDEFGIMFDIGDRYWPVSFAVDLLGSSRTVDYIDGDRTISTGELDLGVRKIFDIYGTSLHPYVGGGLALISATFEDYYFGYGTDTSEDSSAGVWLNGGIYWTFGNIFNLGLDVRYSAADVTLYNFDQARYETVDAGGVHTGLILGVHW